MLIGTIHLDLVKLRELDVEVGRAELVNFLNRARSLLSELVAGEVKNLQPLDAVLLIQGLQFLVLGRESAAGGGVHDKQHLTLVVRE